MDLEKLKARMSEITNELAKFDGKDDFTSEDVEIINTLNSEYEGLKVKAEALQKIADMKNHANASQRQSQTPAPSEPTVPAGQIQVTNRLDKTMGFKNLGEFANAVVNKSKGNMDKRFNNATAYEMISEDGGVLIPDEFMSEIQEKVQGSESLLSRTFGVTVSGNSMSLPIDETEPWNGGVQVYWTGEGKSITESKPQLKLANFRLHKVAGLVKVTDELLEDAPAMESYIRAKAPQAIVSEFNDVIMNGDGVAKPEGFINSGFAIEVAAEGGQAADTIVYKNLIKMDSRLLPNSNAVWIAHPQAKEQLRQLKDDNDNFIYVNGAQFANASATPFDLLLGKPVIYSMEAQALGDKGDISLVDLSYYYSIFKTSGVKQSISTHLYFDRDITAFKFTQRVDGKCPFKAPVTTKYGSYTMSGIITLAAR